MNPLIIFIVLAVAFLGWILWSNLRTGEYRVKSRGFRGYSSGHVKKSEQPGVFWTLVVFHVGLILYIASLAFSLE